MPYIGDFSQSTTVDFKFSTRSAGVPTTLSGSPVVSIYKDNSTTQSTAGVTLTADFDSVTGLNHVRITLSSDTSFYSAGSSFDAVITTGTVGGTSVVGEAVASFSIANRAGYLDVTNSAALHNVVNSPGRQLRAAAGNTEVIYPTSGTVSLASATSSTATLDAGASAVAQAYQWDVIELLTGTGAGQSRLISNYTTGRVATVVPAWTTTPDNTTGFQILPTGQVQVVSYATNQDPGTYVLLTPANKLLTSAAGYVTATGLRIEKNTAYSNFTFAMFDATDPKTPLAGLTVTAQRSIDGGAFASCANSVSAISGGAYKINLANTDLNGDNVILQFTATGAVTRFISIATQTP